VAKLATLTMTQVSDSFEVHVVLADALAHAEWVTLGAIPGLQLCTCDPWLADVPGHHLNITWTGEFCVGICSCGNWSKWAGDELMCISEWTEHTRA
jgi:hypothetical protein